MTNVVKVNFKKKVVAGMAAPSKKKQKNLISMLKKEGYKPEKEFTLSFDNKSNLWLMRMPCTSTITGNPVDMVFWFDGDDSRFAYVTDRGGKALVEHAQKVQ